MQLQSNYPHIKVVVESSPDRIFSDSDYTKAGINVSADISGCDILFGIKEVPIEKLLACKTYIFFSHTIKKQPQSRELLKAILKKQIRLIDYECLKWHDGNRILGFGRYAGLAGTYEAFKALGIKYKLYDLKPPGSFANLDEIEKALSLIAPLIKKQKSKIALAGSGRVSSGSEEMLKIIGIKKVQPQEFLSETFDETVYTLLDTYDLYERKEKKPWSHQHFFDNHSAYTSKFRPYCFVADVLINGVFWDQEMPQHFSKEDTMAKGFSLKLIADISCDIEGSVPITLRETKVENPVYGWDPLLQAECEPYLENSIDVMAVSNLPTEIPADASSGFGNDMLKFVVPQLLKEQSSIIQKATICEAGQLTEAFSYLRDYIED